MSNSPISSIRILGLCGSLRPQSLNLGLLRAARSMLPQGTVLDIHDISALPLYCASREAPFPSSAQVLKQAVAQADALLFAVPEHNYSISAALKNALDWASRPMGTNSWAGKPAVAMGASSSLLGTVRAQYHLRQILGGLDVQVIPQPELFVAGARERVDPSGAFHDEKGRTILAALLTRLVYHARACRAERTTAIPAMAASGVSPGQASSV